MARRPLHFAKGRDCPIPFEYLPRAARDAGPGFIMLSTIVFCESSQQPARIDPAERLVRSLSSLIRANVEGLLGDVAIAGPPGQGLGLIADQAGCALFEAASESEWLRRAIEAARGPELFLLRSGFAPQPGFIEEAGDFLRAGGVDNPGSKHAALLRAAPETFVERLFPHAAPLAGLIAPRDRCVELSANKSALKFAKLARSFNSAASLRTNARRIG
jgi:hypothetical protein